MHAPHRDTVRNAEQGAATQHLDGNEQRSPVPRPPRSMPHLAGRCDRNGDGCARDGTRRFVLLHRCGVAAAQRGPCLAALICTGWGARLALQELPVPSVDQSNCAARSPPYPCSQ